MLQGELFETTCLTSNRVDVSVPAGGLHFCGHPLKIALKYLLSVWYQPKTILFAYLFLCLYRHVRMYVYIHIYLCLCM